MHLNARIFVDESCESFDRLPRKPVIFAKKDKERKQINSYRRERKKAFYQPPPDAAPHPVLPVLPAFADPQASAPDGLPQPPATTGLAGAA
jgi:hypothetical protein